MKRLLSVAVAVTGLLLFTFGAQSTVHAQGADDPAQVTAGKAVFETSCAGCHAADGTGVAGRGRPLTGVADQGDRATHVASITDGKGGMPAFGDLLSADEIDQVTSYVRLSFVEASAQQPTELAMTGRASSGLAILGLVMLAGGLQLVVLSRRAED